MIEHVKQTLKSQFLADNRVWAITFSGGKDSTLVLVLVIEMLMELKQSGIVAKKVYVLSSDTKVELPLAEGYLHNKLNQIESFAKETGLNLEVVRLHPKLEDDFFVCMLGKGYPAPNMNFRWCTTRLKIAPATLFLNALISEHQSMILLLGVRNQESTARAESIEKRIVNDRDLTIHDTIANCYTYSPIKDVKVDDLWSYLSKDNCKAPYGDHKDMMKLYDKGSGEADCNIALNPKAPACGKTRLGCWVCTVVEKDSSMEAMIKDAEFSWMKPLNDFRNKIQAYRYDHSTRREKTKLGKNFPGAFLLEIRKELFEDLLKAEVIINGNMVKVTQRGVLLTDEQILAINQEHRKDGDFSNDVLKIANRYGRNFLIDDNINPVLQSVCQSTGLDPEFFNEVLDLNLKHRHSLRRIGITTSQKQLIHQFSQGVAHADK